MTDFEQLRKKAEELRQKLNYHSTRYYEMDAPEIDGRISFTTSKNYEVGDFADVVVIGINDYDLIGKDING